jgi:hypothetical protein
MTAVRVVPVVDDHLVDPLAGDLRNAGSPFDKLTARRHPPDAAFMSLPEGSDPPTDQGSALWCLCDLHMPLGE